MKKVFFQILILATIIFLSSCSLIKNSAKYSSITKEFVTHLLNKDYDKCIGLMAMNSEAAVGTNLDTLKKGLDDFRNIIVTNFGDQLEYTFMKSEKTFSSESRTQAATTLVLMQFSNKKEFGVLQVIFDDKSRDIISIKTLDVKEPIPNMILYWLFGILALGVLAFNIYMIRKVKLSNIKKKWQKYLAIVLLNVPAIGYKAIGGFFMNLLSFQILLGISFEKMGYLGSSWTLGIPLGGLYVLSKLRKQNVEIIEEAELGDAVVVASE